MSTTIHGTAEILPSGLCSSINANPDPLQGLLNMVAQYLAITLPDMTTNLSKGKTPPTDLTASWFKLDSSDKPIGLCCYASGAWIRPHPYLPGTIKLWLQALPDFDSYDGGDNSVVGPVSGPMWEEATELRARIPIGVGTLPSAQAVTISGADSTGGYETVTLTSDQIPAHTHNISAMSTLDIDETSNRTLAGTGGNAGEFSGFMATTSVGGGLSHSNMPPWIGVYFIRRTNRLFYREG